MCSPFPRMRRMRAMPTCSSTICCDPHVAARNSNLVKYANGDLASRPYLDKSVLHDAGIYPPPAVMHTLVPERAKSMQFMRLLTRAWTHFKTGS